MDQFLKIFSIFSQYELKARFFPGIIVLTPFALAILILYPELISLESSIFTIMAVIVIIFFLAKLSREAGKKKEKNLMKKMGNYPSTIMLRYSDNEIDSVTKQRYHNFFKENVHGIELPSSSDHEKENPDFYEQQYNSAVKWLLENTRDYKKYDLLLQDNINYGFSRNMLGIKPFGIFFSIVACIINPYTLLVHNNHNLSQIPLKVWLSYLVYIIFLSLWIFFVKEKWVKSTAFAYARTLLATCEKR